MVCACFDWAVGVVDLDGAAEVGGFDAAAVVGDADAVEAWDADDDVGEVFFAVGECRVGLDLDDGAALGLDDLGGELHALVECSLEFAVGVPDAAVDDDHCLVAIPPVAVDFDDAGEVFDIDRDELVGGEVECEAVDVGGLACGEGDECCEECDGCEEACHGVSVRSGGACLLWHFSGWWGVIA